MSVRRVVVAAALLAAAAGACSRREVAPAPSVDPTSPAPPARPPLPADRFSEEGMLAEAAHYLDDPRFRRAVLVESLTNPTNTYSRQRLDSYGLETKGWDLLPEWNPQSGPVTSATAARIRAGEAVVVDPATPRLWDGKRPTTIAGWVALGRETFFGYPLRVEVFMNFALAHPDIGGRVGVRVDRDGTYPGVRAFVDVRGKSAIGITCAVCHADVGGGGGVTTGQARRSFDYGALRLAYHATEHVAVDGDLARRMKSWGPGRADVTEDDDEDPVAIPDLWGLKHQTLLTQAGTIKHIGPTALAIRQETQLLHSNHQKVRPPRELAYALALYLYSLEPPPPVSAGGTERGAELFAKRCKGCHSNAALGGPAVLAEKVGTDRALATGGARGTGTYRPPALLHVAAAAPYFHHGAVPTLDDVLSPARLEASYARSPLGKGPVAGHRYGVDLPAADRAALVDYLRSL